MDKLKDSESHEIQLSVRLAYVNARLRRICLIVGITMLVAAVVFLNIAIYNGVVAYGDFMDYTVDNVTLDRVNQLVASTLMMLLTVTTSTIFLRVYRGQSPFVRSNIKAIRAIAVMLMMLSILPIGVQVAMGIFFHIRVGFNMNVMYVFIAAGFYCISYIFEHGSITQKMSEEMLKVYESIIFQYAEVSETKSGQVSQHVRRMTEYSRILASNLDMSEREIEVIRIAAIMHDIGKILIPPEILKQESSLNDEESAIMKTHVVAGEELLYEATGEIMETARRMALDHHENWDGTGYLGKKGEEIDRGAQIIALADMFDTLVTARSYKKGWEMNRLYSTIIDESGKKFDPAVVDAFMRGYRDMLEVYDNYDKTITSDYEVPEHIIESYDKILGEYSPRLKPAEEDNTTDNAYQGVELDLRRLI